MAVVRELVTLLRYNVDRTGLDEYSSALKKLAGWIAGAFAVHEVIETADVWNTIAGRISNVVDGTIEQTKVMEALEKQALATGGSFESIGSLFTQITTTGSLLHYTTDQVLDLTSAIAKMTTLGGGTAAGAKRGMIQIEEMFSLGKIQIQHLKALMIDIPGAWDIIAKAFGGREKADKLVHSGQMTSKMFGDAFLKMHDEIDRRFEKMPLTFARAFESIHTLFGDLIYDIGKSSGIWTTMAKAIVAGGHAIDDTIRGVAKAVGGFTNLLELAGIGAIAAFGPSVLALIGRLVVAIRGITLASVLAAAPWYVIAALILAVGLAVQDVWTWMQGGASIIGDLIGPWSEWKDTVLGWRDAAVAAFDEVKAAVGELGAGLGKELSEGWTQSKVQLDEFRDLLSRLVPELDLGKDWTLGKVVHETLVELTELIRLLGTPATFLNDLQANLNDAGTAAHDYFAGKYHKWFPPTPTDPSSLVPPASLMPPGAQTATINSNVTNNITSASDTPQAIGDAAAKGTRSGLADGLGRSLGIMSPAVEFGVGY